MKGDVIRFVQKKKTDELTGVQVVRLTDDQGDTDHPYFTASQMDRESGHMIVSSNRSGKTQLYTLNLTAGQMVQLTDDADVKSGCLDTGHHRVFYFAERPSGGHVFKSVQIDDLSEEELMEVPPGFIPASLSCTNDGRFVAFTMVELEGVELATARFTPEFSGGSKGFREKFFRWPSSVIIRYDTLHNVGHVVTGELRRMTHVIIHPLNGDIVLFCHEGPWHLVQRMWIAKVDTEEVFPLIETQRLLERVGHEFFTTSGRVGAQYSYRYRPDIDFLLHADIYVNPDGSDERRYYYPYRRPVHVQAHPEERMAVGDTAQIREHDPDYQNHIALVKYDNERHASIVGRLCSHGASWRKSSHPHPVFTPDGRHVVWGSDLGGKMNLYMARAEWDKCIKSDR